MTDSPTAAPERKKIWALLMSTKPKRREELLDDLGTSDHGRAVLATVAIDPDQARSFEDARGALRIGANGIPHIMLIIGGELAIKMKKGEIDKLVDVSLSGWKLLVMGLADNEEERRALDELGVRWILRRGATGVDHYNQFVSAREELGHRAAQHKAATSTAPAPVVIHKHSSDGLFPRQAVIVVHATKGGVGKTNIAANLAYGLSLSGEPTVLVDLNADSGHIDRLFATLLFKGRDAYQNREELFATKGLSWLASQIRHDNASQKISPQALQDAVLPLIDRKDQRLDLLPGIYDQSDYEGGAASPAAALLSKKEWINELISNLRAPKDGWSYVVIDTGINRYTSFARMAIAAADLLTVVVNSSSQSEIESEAQAMHKMLQGVAMGKYPHLKGKRLVIANMLMPRGTQFAPTIEQVRREFEFFGPEDVLPVAFDLNAKLTSEHERLPVLAIKESTLPLVRSPMRSDLQTVVNAIVKVYGDDGAQKSKGGKRLFGRA